MGDNLATRSYMSNTWGITRLRLAGFPMQRR